MGVRVWALRILGLASVALVVVGAGLVLTSGRSAAEGPGVGAAREPRASAAQQPATGSAPEPAQVRQAGREVRVFFSRRPESDDDFTAVFPVTRTAPDAGIAAAALRALIAGPTPAEAVGGYFSELGSMLVGPSTCGGPDFTIRIDAGLATVRFCREISSAGIGQDARAQSALQATLRQFSTVQRVRLLGPNGDCLFDMSGENRCLATP